MHKKNSHLIMILIGGIILLLLLFHDNLWFDESYTVSIVRHSFQDIFYIASYDVHPILYYYILHLLFLIFGNNLIIYRIFSWLCIVLNAILGYTHIRHDFDDQVGFYFSFFSLFLPGLMLYAGEIRMYSLGLFLSSLSIIYAYRCYKNSSIKNLLLFGLSSILLAYTHYYGLMLAGILNLIIMYFIFKRKNKVVIKKYLMVAIGEIIIYLPWILKFLSQVLSVSKGFWISFKFPKTLFELLTVQFHGSLDLWLAIIFTIIFYGFLFFKKTYLHHKIKYISEIRWCSLIYIGIIFITLFISLIMHSMILLDRYLIILTPLLLLTFSFLLVNKKNREYLLGMTIFFFILSFINLFVDNYSIKNYDVISYVESNYKEDDIILYQDIIGANVTTRLPNLNTYFYNKEKWNIYEAYKAFDFNIVDELSFLKNTNGKIILIDSKKTQNILDEIKKMGDVLVIEEKYFYSPYKDEDFYITIIRFERFDKLEF